MRWPSVNWIGSKILSYFQPETPRDHEKALRCARVIAAEIERVQGNKAKELDAAWDALFAVHLTQGLSGLPLDKAITQELDGLLEQIRAGQSYLDDATREVRAQQERNFLLMDLLLGIRVNLADEIEGRIWPGGRTLDVVLDELLGRNGESERRCTNE